MFGVRAALRNTWRIGLEALDLKFKFYNLIKVFIFLIMHVLAPATYPSTAENTVNTKKKDATMDTMW